MRMLRTIGFIICISVIFATFSIVHAIELKRMPAPVTQQTQQPKPVPDILSISFPNSPQAPSASLTQGQGYTLMLTVKDMDKTMGLSFGEGIQLSNIQYLSNTSIKMDVKVSPTAVIGKHDIKITYGSQSRTAKAFVTVVKPSKPVLSQIPAPPVSQKPLQQTPAAASVPAPTVSVDQPPASKVETVPRKVVKPSDMTTLNPQPEPPKPVTSQEPVQPIAKALDKPSDVITKPATSRELPVPPAPKTGIAPKVVRPGDMVGLNPQPEPPHPDIAVSQIKDLNTKVTPTSSVSQEIIGKTEVVQKPQLQELPSKKMVSAKAEVQSGSLNSLIGILSSPRITSSGDLWPGYYTIIKGTGFGTSQGRVKLLGKFPDESIELNENIHWSETGIGVKTPPLTGVKDQDAKLQVVTSDGKSSNEWPVKFIATRDHARLLAKAVKVVTCSQNGCCNNCPIDEYLPTSFFLHAEHSAPNCDRPYSGTDEYMAQLKNGWVFYYIYFSPSGYNVWSVPSEPNGFVSGASQVDLSINWSATATLSDEVCSESVAAYYADVDIIGPIGVPFQ